MESGQPPKAVLFNNPEHKEWDAWDYKIFKAHYIVKDWYRNGIPIWWDESDRVTFDALGRVSKSRAAIDRAEESANKNNKKPVPGRYFIAEPRVIDGGEFPTRDEWLEEVALKKGNNTSMSKFGTQRDSGNIIQGRK